MRPHAPALHLVSQLGRRLLRRARALPPRTGWVIGDDALYSRATAEAQRQVRLLWQMLRVGVLLGAAPLCWAASRPVASAEASLYELLGVERSASEQEIKKAYKRAAVRTHPDKAPEGQREAYEESFKKVSRAYEILSDPQKRRIYDAQGEAAFQGNDADGGPGAGPSGNPFGGTDPFEMFSSMFGEGFQGFSSRRRRTPDVGYYMELSLEELYRGSSRELQYDQDVVCTNCGGNGATRFDVCSTCRGAGYTVTTRQMGGFTTQFRQGCNACQGSGRTVPAGCLCSQCRGAGVVRRPVKLPIEAPPGCATGRRFVFKGCADEAPDMETGDIIVEVWEKKHPVFTRLNDTDLLLQQKVPLLDALCGVRFTVKHLDGQDYEIACPEGQVVRPGEVWIVKGRGMPSAGARGGHGDLIVRFEVDFPEKLPAGVGIGGTSYRDQLKQLIDPQAPSQPGASKSWWSFGSSKNGETLKAARAGPQRSKDVELQLAEKQAEEEGGRGPRGGGRGRNAQCAQM